MRPDHCGGARGCGAKPVNDEVVCVAVCVFYVSASVCARTTCNKFAEVAELDTSHKELDTKVACMHKIHAFDKHYDIHRICTLN